MLRRQLTMHNSSFVTKSCYRVRSSCYNSGSSFQITPSERKRSASAALSKRTSRFTAGQCPKWPNGAWQRLQAFVASCVMATEMALDSVLILASKRFIFPPLSSESLPRLQVLAGDPVRLRNTRQRFRIGLQESACQSCAAYPQGLRLHLLSQPLQLRLRKQLVLPFSPPKAFNHAPTDAVRGRMADGLALIFVGAWVTVR